jgi:hypothetical protein
MANISYIRLLQAVELFSKEHMQVKRFASDFPAQMPNFGTESEKYPILFVSPTDTIFNENVTTFTIDIYCFDIIQKDRSNINTILSDTNLILSDLHRWFLDGEIFGLDIREQVTTTPIDNALLDYAAGWRMTATFDVDTYGICEIPFINEPVILMEVNDVVYTTTLTCDTLADCDTFTYAIDNLQTQIDNIEITGATGPQGIQGVTGPTGPGNPIVSGYFTPNQNTLTLVDSLGGEVVIDNEINIIDISLSDILVLITDRKLVRGVTYRIDSVDDLLYGYGNGGNGSVIYLLALEDDKLDTFGTGIFYTPKYTEFPIWQSTSSYVENEKVIWGGYVWRNLSTNVGSSNSDYELNEEWELISYDKDNYNIVYDKIKYDIDNDKIIYRNEKNINEVSFNYDELTKIQNDTADYCPIKAFQWGKGFSYDTDEQRFVGIGNQRITNSYNNNINFVGILQDNFILNNQSYIYNINSNQNTIMSNITLNNRSMINGISQGNFILNNQNTMSNITLNNRSMISNINIYGDITFTFISLNNSSMINEIYLYDECNLSFFDLDNLSEVSNLQIINSTLSRYKLDNNSVINSCIITNTNNYNMLYDNNASQNQTDNSGVSIYYYQANTTVKNTQISVVDRDQDGWFFLGDLPDEETLDVIGRVNDNKLVDTKIQSITRTSQLINDGDNGTSHFISLEDLPSTLVFYATSATSSIGGYNKLVTSITDPIYNQTAVDITTGHITGTDQFIAGLISEPNQIIGNPGVFNLTTIGNIRKTNGSGGAEFFFRIYKRQVNGTETLILQSNNTQEITTTIYSEFYVSGLWNSDAFITSDRIVIKFYGTKVGGGSDPIYDFQFGGTNPVRTIVPVPLSVIPGITWIQLTSEGRTNGISIPITDGYYLVYDYKGETIYRYITSEIDSNGYPLKDEFYSSLIGTTLLDLIKKRY